MQWPEFISLVFIGLAAGTVGGLLGIGGSIILIPVLTLLFKHDQHLSQAAAMITNVFVAAPALLRHQRANAVDWVVFRRMLPAGLVLIVVGVEVSNQLDGRMLMRLFGIFLIYVIYVNVHKLFEPSLPANGDNGHRGWIRSSTVATITGFMAGLLGVGGGIITVPLLQRICHLPLRRCIATSAAIMCVTAAIGAIRKNLALSHLADGVTGAPLDPMESLLIAACLAPTAIIGGLLGAGWTHSLPLHWLRGAFVVVLAVACAKFLGVF